MDDSPVHHSIEERTQLQEKEPFLHLQPLGTSVPGFNTLCAEMCQIGIDSKDSACLTNLLAVTELSAVSAVLWSAWGTRLPRTCRSRTGLMQPGE